VTATGLRYWIIFTAASRKLDDAGEDGGMRPNTPVDTDIPCPTCGRHMQIRTGSTGVFLGCSGYSLPPKERCTQTLNLIPGEEAISADEDEEAESRRLMEKRRCPICDSAMDSYLLDEQRKVHICGNNPDCSGFEVESGQFKIKGYDGPTLDCDKCGSEMQLKSGRFGKYFGCTNSECKNTRKLLKSGEAAPPKMDPIPMPELQCQKVDDTYVLRDGASGLFLAASQFPKNRETRPPQVQELLAHQAELPQKYHYLLDAPRTDKDNNPAVIRYSRKSKEQYVMSEVEGKATGWSAWYTDGKWTEENKKKSPAKKTTKVAEK
jgi:DNA topoisomerase-1